MKTLFAIRHAKSSWGEPSLPDHARPLNERGLRDAVRMGEVLQQQEVKPDAILSSTANRARTTAGMIAEALGFADTAILEDDQWYLASAKVWLQSVQQIEESVDVAMIFGHNPGMADFAERAVREREVIGSFPTLAVAQLNWDVDYWGEVDFGDAQLVKLLLPREL